jgi:hypothetical protein
MVERPLPHRHRRQAETGPGTATCGVASRRRGGRAIISRDTRPRHDVAAFDVAAFDVAASAQGLFGDGRRTEAANPRSAPPSSNIDAGSCGDCVVLLLIPNALATDQPMMAAVATAQTNLLRTRDVG